MIPTIIERQVHHTKIVVFQKMLYKQNTVHFKEK